ncbi:MAG: DUF3352 domain-containing protein [Chloroflexi bacterium]|nr:DUF3352 domain-containing protein [Chloroflexota bacterium]
MTARTRWLIGGGVAAGAVVVAIAAALLLSSRPVPEALKYVPGNAVVVAELRLDLPGDQLQKVGNLLAHFPGFADQSTLGAKLDETLDRLAKGVTNGSVDYATKLKPWLAGPTFVGILAGGSGAGGSADGSMACFMDGKFGLLGTPAGIQAALAAHTGGTGIDRDATYSKARDTLGGDRLATVYVSGTAAALMQSVQASMPASLPISLPTAAALPEWMIAGIRAEDDALVADLYVAPPKTGSGASAAAGSPLPTLPPPHVSDIAGFLPGNTVLLAELHGVGVTAQTALAALRSDPQFQSQAAQLDAALSLAGGPEGVVGWVSDAGVVAIPQTTTSAAGTTPGIDAGLVLVATDEATATTKVAQLKSLLSLMALSGGGSTTDVNVDGTTVTTIDLGDLSSLLNQAGAGGSLGGLTIPSDLRVKITLAVRGKLVLIGGDEGFARDVLHVDAGATLADQAAYKRSIDRGSASNLGQVYVAGASLRQLATTLLPADLRARWQADFLPFVEPIDAVLVTSTLEHGLSHTRVVLSVSTPPPTPAAS